MPYIKPERRLEIVKQWKTGLDIEIEEIEFVGELNFAITVLCREFMKKNGKSYKTINDIVGVLECVKQEFYRKIAAPYEEDKEMENGSVY
jgi:hypothetical protein